MTKVRIEALTKSFGASKALSEVSIDVASGEMVALIGASGSGKSTLIRHVAGLLAADGDSRSRIVVGEVVMQERGRLAGDAQRLRRDVGVVFQQFNLVARLKVLTNVLTGLLGRVPRWRGTLALFTRTEKQAALRALERVGIVETAGRRASTLSGGQQQRAAIARALVQGAKVLLADEPIASLDPASAKRVMETLAEINRAEGITVIVSLHQVEYARRYCPRTIALRDGAVAYDGPSVALTHDMLRALYGEASDELVLPEGPLPAEPARPAPASGLETAYA